MSINRLVRSNLTTMSAGDTIMMSLPFITPSELDELISKYGKALKATEEKVKELKSQQK